MNKKRLTFVLILCIAICAALMAPMVLAANVSLSFTMEVNDTAVTDGAYNVYYTADAVFAKGNKLAESGSTFSYPSEVSDEGYIHITTQADTDTVIYTAEIADVKSAVVPAPGNGTLKLYSSYNGSTTSYFTLWKDFNTSWGILGSGTEDDPYQISTGAQLAFAAKDSARRNAYYILTADIDLGAHYWTPWGTEGTGVNTTVWSSDLYNAGFMGKFNGDGHTISNMTSDPRSQYGGLFGVISGSINSGYINTYGDVDTVTNLIMYNAKVELCSGVSDAFAGAVAGRTWGNSYARITNCAVTGANSKVTLLNNTQGRVGGVVGYLSEGGVYNCVNHATVSSANQANSNAGGLVGAINGTSSFMSNCYSTGDVSGYTSGALVGTNYGNISYCYFKKDACTPDGNDGVGNGNDAVNSGYFDGSDTDCVLTGRSTTVTSGSKVAVGAYLLDLLNNYAATVEYSNYDPVCWRNVSDSNELVQPELSFVWNGKAAKPRGATYFAGAGTDADPYKICTSEDMHLLAALVNDPGTNAAYAGKEYQVCTNLRLNRVDQFANGSYERFDERSTINTAKADNVEFLTNNTWTPIGTSTYKFSGVIKGYDKFCGSRIDSEDDEFNISGLKITSGTGAGLVGYAATLTVDNLAVVQSNVTATGEAGFLVGNASGAVSFKDVHGYGRVSAGEYTGGLAGKLGTDAGFVHAQFTGSVDGSNYVGGLVGGIVGGGNVSFKGFSSFRMADAKRYHDSTLCTASTYFSCNVRAAVSGTGVNVGGFAGYVSAAAFYITSNADDTVITVPNEQITEYAAAYPTTVSGSVQGTSSVGGFVGYLKTTGTAGFYALDNTLTVTDSVTHTSRAFGLMGSSHVADVIYTTGGMTVTATGATGEAGGAVGEIEAGGAVSVEYFDRSKTTGSDNTTPVGRSAVVKAESGSYVGGFAGKLTAGTLGGEAASPTVTNGADLSVKYVSLTATAAAGTVESPIAATGTIGGQSYVGGFAGWLGSGELTVKDVCISAVPVTGTGDKVGGFAGSMSTSGYDIGGSELKWAYLADSDSRAIAKNIRLTNNVISGTSVTGGFAGEWGDAGTGGMAKNIYITGGTVTGSSGVQNGGFAGNYIQTAGSGTIDDVVVKGTVITGVGETGGVFGRLYSNSGAINVRNSMLDESGRVAASGDKVGGFAGLVDGANATVQNCAVYRDNVTKQEDNTTFYNTVSGGTNVGGFAGSVLNGAKIQNNVSNARLSAATLGGIAGSVTGTDNVRFNYWYSVGSGAKAIGSTGDGANRSFAEPGAGAKVYTTIGAFLAGTDAAASDANGTYYLYRANFDALNGGASLNTNNYDMVNGKSYIYAVNYDLSGFQGAYDIEYNADTDKLTLSGGGVVSAKVYFFNGTVWAKSPSTSDTAKLPDLYEVVKVRDVLNLYNRAFNGDVGYEFNEDTIECDYTPGGDYFEWYCGYDSSAVNNYHGGTPQFTTPVFSVEYYGGYSNQHGTRAGGNYTAAKGWQSFVKPTWLIGGYNWDPYATNAVSITAESGYGVPDRSYAYNYHYGVLSDMSRQYSINSNSLTSRGFRSLVDDAVIIMNSQPNLYRFYSRVCSDDLAYTPAAGDNLTAYIDTRYIDFGAVTNQKSAFAAASPAAADRRFALTSSGGELYKFSVTYAAADAATYNTYTLTANDGTTTTTPTTDAATKRAAGEYWLYVFNNETLLTRVKIPVTSYHYSSDKTANSAYNGDYNGSGTYYSRYNTSAPNQTGGYYAVNQFGQEALYAIPTTAWTSAGAFDGGSGTAADPYKIGTAEQLAYLASLVNSNNTAYNADGKYYKLTADIDLHTKKWTPIGGTNAFAAHFDGDGHTIKGLYVDGSGYLALFGKVSGEVKNLGVENSYVKNLYSSSSTYAATIVGDLNGAGASIANCWTTGTVCVGSTGGTVYSYTSPGGSIVGKVTSGTAQYCVSTGQVICYGISDKKYYGNNYGGVVGPVDGTAHHLFWNNGCSYGSYTSGGTVSNSVSITSEGKLQTGVAYEGSGASTSDILLTVLNTWVKAENAKPADKTNPAYYMWAYSTTVPKPSFLAKKTITLSSTTPNAFKPDYGYIFAGQEQALTITGTNAAKMLAVTPVPTVTPNGAGSVKNGSYAPTDAGGTLTLVAADNADNITINLTDENVATTFSFAITVDGADIKSKNGNLVVTVSKDASPATLVYDSGKFASANGATLSSGTYTLTIKESSDASAKVLYTASLGQVNRSYTTDIALFGQRIGMSGYYKVPEETWSEPNAFTGDGSEEHPWLVENAQQLFYLAQEVNAAQFPTSYSGVFFKLGADIDLSSKAWTPIGGDGKPFAGSFDGDGHTIKGLYVGGGSSAYQGLFGNVTGEVKNLAVINAYVTGASGTTGIIAGSGTVKNCFTSAAPIVGGGAATGVIAANNNYVLAANTAAISTENLTTLNNKVREAAWNGSETAPKYLEWVAGSFTAGSTTYTDPFNELHYTVSTQANVTANIGVIFSGTTRDVILTTTNAYRFPASLAGGYTRDANDIQKASGSITASSANITIPVAVEDNNYNVIYDMNGGTKQTGTVSSKSVTYNTSYSIENLDTDTKPTKTGYTFAGWRRDASTLYSSAASFTMPESDVTLTAEWTAANVKVTVNHFVMDSTGQYVKDEAASGKEVTDEFKSGQTLTFANLATSGYTNNGSTIVVTNGITYHHATYTNTSVTTAAEASSAAVAADGKLVVNLYYNRQQRHVTVYQYKQIAAGQYEKIDQAAIDKNYYYEETVDMTGKNIDGFAYIGLFDTESAVAETSYFNLTGNKGDFVEVGAGTAALTYYAKYDLNGFAVTLDLNKGSFASGGSTTLNYNAYSTATVPTVSRAGYSFAGWEITSGANEKWVADADGIDYPAGTTVSVAGKSGNVALKAQWTLDKPTYTVKTESAAGSDYESGKWTNKNVVFTLSSNAADADKAFQFCTDTSAEPQVWSDITGNTLTIELDTASTAYAFRVTADGYTSLNADAVTTVKRDTTEPTVTADEISITNGWSASNKTLTVTPDADAPAEGVKSPRSYAINKSGSSEPSVWTALGEDTSIDFTIEAENGTVNTDKYFVWVKDEAGSTACYPLSGEGIASDVDKTKPEAAIVVTNEADGRGKIVGSGTDTGSGVASYAWTTTSAEPAEGDWADYTETAGLTKNIAAADENRTWYFWVKDGVGNVSTSKTSTAYVVTYHSNDAGVPGAGAQESTESVIAMAGIPLTLKGSNAYSNTVAEISKWNTASGGTGDDYSCGTAYTFTADTGLFAQWQDRVYHVYYENSLINAEGFSAVPGEYGYTGEVVLPHYTQAGYVFSGWKVKTSVGGWTAGTVYSVTYGEGGTPDFSALTIAAGQYGDVTMTAQWSPNTYDITLAPNGGTVAQASLTYTPADTIEIPVITRDGYTFEGWAASGENNWGAGPFNGEAGEAVSIPNAQFNKYGDVTLTAKWAVKAPDVEAESGESDYIYGNWANRNVVFTLESEAEGVTLYWTNDPDEANPYDQETEAELYAAFTPWVEITDVELAGGVTTAMVECSADTAAEGKLYYFKAVTSEDEPSAYTVYSAETGAYNVKLDKTPPMFDETAPVELWKLDADEVTDEWTANGKRISITATDELSGIEGYAISTSCIVAPDENVWQGGSVVTVTANGTFYAWVRDNAGNTAVYAMGVETKINAEGPQMSLIAANESDGSVTLTGMASDDDVSVSGYLFTTSSDTPDPEESIWTAWPTDEEIEAQTASDVAEKTIEDITDPAGDTWYFWAKDSENQMSSLSITIYKVGYAPNGGDGEAFFALKAHGYPLGLEGETYTRENYTHKSWNTSGYGTGRTYALGGRYLNNESATLSAMWERNGFTVSYNGGHAVLSPTSARANGSYNGELTPNANYTLPAALTATMDGAPFTDFEYSHGAISVASGKITGDVVFSGSCTYNQPFDPNEGGGAPVAPPKTETKAPVFVDGVEYDIGETKTESGVTTVTPDSEKLGEQVADSKDKGEVIVPVTKAEEANTAAASLVVKSIEDMAAKEITLTVETGGVSYQIPTSKLDTAALMEELKATDSQAVPVTISIKAVDAETAKTIAGKLETGDMELVLEPVEFTVTASYDGRSVEVETFNDYVARVFEITEEQAAKITTAVVYEADGSVRHVPTQVYRENGKWYAKVSSITNSTYALIFNEASFTDSEGKWYSDIVAEMASRKVINGRTTEIFDGDAGITRAEFSAILVRALGLPATGDGTVFTDVESGDWFCGAVGTAYKYGLIQGKGDKMFAPNASITRQEAMAMVQRAAALTGFEGEKGTIEAFADAGSVAAWAKAAAEWNVGSGLIQGNSAGMICGQSNISRGETATIVLRLLQMSKLVDVRSKA